MLREPGHAGSAGNAMSDAAAKAARLLEPCEPPMATQTHLVELVGKPAFGTPWQGEELRVVPAGGRKLARLIRDALLARARRDAVGAA